MNPMAVVSSMAVSVFFLAILCLNASIVAQAETIIARTGDDVTLTCFGPGSVRVAEWYVDGDHQRYVYSWRGGDRPDVENQLQQYVGRVSVKNLEEEKKKNGNNTDVSLTINSVTPSDSGTYECHVSNGTVDHSVTDTSFGTKSLRDTTVLVVDEIITACPGDDVPLACDLPATVDAEGPVCSCVRDRQPDVSVDCRMSHGNISLVKKNLKPDDSGVYACSATGSVKKTVYYVDVSGHTAGREEEEEEEEGEGRGRKKRGCEGTTEDDHSHTDRSQLGLIIGLVLAGLTVAAGLVLAPVGYWLYKKQKRQKTKDNGDDANERIAL